MRRALFWVHLAAGCLAGTIVLVMSVTGVLLTYQSQIVALADGDHRSVAAPGAVRLPPEELLARVQRERPGSEASALSVSSEPDAAVLVTLEGDGVVFVDAYDGRILGNASTRTRSFFQGVTAWHRWLAMEGESRATGKAITGASNLAFLFLVLSGAILWWPRERSWPSVRSVAVPYWRLRGRARDFNWHNVTGLWLWLPLVLIVFSGAVISYPWMGDLLYVALGETPPPRAERPAPPAPRAGDRDASRGPAANRAQGLDRLWAKAATHEPGWQTLTARLPPGSGPVSFTIDTHRGAIRPDRRASLVLDRATADVVRSDNYQAQSPARRVRGWLRWIHTGEAAGVWGQTVAGLASAGGALLVWTGLAMSVRRFNAWRQRRAATSPVRVFVEPPMPIEGEET